MWQRKEIKARGKAAFKAHYWTCVVVSFIMDLLIGGVAVASSSKYSKSPDAAVDGFVKELDGVLAGGAESLVTILAILGGILALVLAISLLINVFVRNVFVVGGDKFYVQNAKGEGHVGDIFGGFKNGYMRNVGAMFLRDLFIVLGYICFFIPGVILTYSFRMVPYILADEDSAELSSMDVIKRSCKIMKGNKWRSFVVSLSFIWWELLSALTFGILRIFYVKPYEDATFAELYRAIK